jgi:hypothetical protein
LRKPLVFFFVAGVCRPAQREPGGAGLARPKPAKIFIIIWPPIKNSIKKGMNFCWLWLSV